MQLGFDVESFLICMSDGDLEAGDEISIVHWPKSALEFLGKHFYWYVL